jgi:hypothetical protein
MYKDTKNVLQWKISNYDYLICLHRTMETP